MSDDAPTMISVFRKHDRAGEAWSIGPWHEQVDAAAAQRFDDVGAALAWLHGFEADDLRRVLLRHGEGSAIARLTDHDVRDALARRLVDGRLLACNAAADRRPDDARFDDLQDGGPAARIVRRLRITGRLFDFDDERLRLATAAQWKRLLDLGDARHEAVANDFARPLLAKLSRWPALADDERRALGEALPLLIDARAPPSLDGIVLLRVVARTAAIAVERGEPASTPSQAAGRRPNEELHWIEIVLVDTDGDPVPDEPYLLELPDGAVRNGRLDKDGQAHEGGIKTAGQCRVCFPQIDAREWRPA